MSKCKHADSMWGRCVDCGLTWEGQAEEREQASRGVQQIPEHLEVAAALAVLAEDLDFMGQCDLADRALAMAGRLGYVAPRAVPRHELDFALAQQGGGTR